jgi:triosephosphate isomerase
MSRAPSKNLQPMATPKTSFTPLVIANWKMQLDAATTIARIQQVKTALKNFRGRTRPVICPSFPALGQAAKALQRSVIKLGAQNVAWDDRGAYTGEVSAGQLREQGVEYVIIGHSERRQLLGETEVMVARKMIAAITHNLMPILCVGENATERANGEHDLVVRRQLDSALRSLPPPVKNRHVYIAYEQIWAIGTGEPADPMLADDIRELIQRTLVDLYSPAVVEHGFRIIYGGSVDDDNILDYVRPGGYTGALVGNASLDAGKFATMVKRTNDKFSPRS